MSKGWASGLGTEIDQEILVNSEAAFVGVNVDFHQRTAVTERRENLAN